MESEFDYSEVTIANMDNSKKDNFYNDDIFNYLHKFKDEVTRDNKNMEKKVESIEQRIEEKLERMKTDMDAKLREEIKDNRDENNKVTKRMEKIESIVNGGK